jgi:hypothetical protein
MTSHQFMKVLERQGSKTSAPNQEPKTDSPSSSIAKPSKGRPLNSKRHESLAAVKPWEDLGMSRATWFNRQREARIKQ